MRYPLIFAAFGALSAFGHPIAEADTSSESLPTPSVAVVASADEDVVVIERGEEAELHHEKHKWIGNYGQMCKAVKKHHKTFKYETFWDIHGGNDCNGLWDNGDWDKTEYDIKDKREEAADMAEIEESETSVEASSMTETAAEGGRHKTKIKRKLPDGHKCKLKIKDDPQNGIRWKRSEGQRCRTSYFDGSYEKGVYKHKVEGEHVKKRDEASPLAEIANTGKTGTMVETGALDSKEHIKWQIPGGSYCEVRVKWDPTNGNRYKWKHGGEQCEASYTNDSYKKWLSYRSMKPKHGF